MANKLICRTCLKKELPEFCKNISPEDNDESSNILEMLNYCVPELDIFLVINPVMCRSCINLLETAFKFKTQCLTLEERFLKFSHSTNSKIDLKIFEKNVHTFNNNANTVINNNKGSLDVEIIKIELIPLEEDIHNPKELIPSEEDIHNPKEDTELTNQKTNDQRRPQLNCQKCYGCENNLTDPSYHSKVYRNPYECFNCDKQLNTISDCRKHMMSHRRPRKCKVCNRFFRDLYQLSTHLRTHTGAKPFACQLCSKSFRQKHNLDQHLRQHQGHSTVKCKICDKVMSTKYNLKIHMLNMHVKKPECELCGEKFYTKAALIKHLETDSETCGNVDVKPEASTESFEETVVKIEPEVVDANDTIQNLYKEEYSGNNRR